MNFFVVKKYLQLKMAILFEDEHGELGLNAIIGIAIGLIVTAFILIPGIQAFASKIMTDMQTWWDGSISTKVFVK